MVNESGDVDNDVEGALLLGKPGDLRIIRDVQDGGRQALVRLELHEQRGVDVGGEHERLLARHGDRRGAADALRRRCDQYPLARQSSRHPCLRRGRPRARPMLVHRRIRPIHLIAGTQAGDQRPFRVTASG